MGAALSVLVPHLVLGTAGFFLLGKFGIVGGCSIPLLCEVGHAVADETVHNVGRHAVGDVVRDRLYWEVTDIGIRAYSLNFCGPLNYFFDFFRQLLSPLAFSFSGHMTHEVVIFTIRNPLDDCSVKAAYLLLCKCHSGDIIIAIFDTLEDADVIAKPCVFGAPKGAWWGQRVYSHGFCVRDVVDKVLLCPAVYRTVTDNCHHFVKEIWNWHVTARLAVANDRFHTEQRRLEKVRCTKF